MNFFDTHCQEPSFAHKEFGLCDDSNTTKAYTDIRNPEKWIATVKNPNGLQITFTAVDKCVIKDSEEKGRGRCDAMLTSSTAEHLYLVELKDKRARWQEEAIRQLESTVQLLLANHPEQVKRFKRKKAFACNKKAAPFIVLEQEDKLHFWKNYGFHLDLQAEIIIL